MDKITYTFLPNNMLFVFMANAYGIIICIIFQAVTDDMLLELKSCFMEAYDDNQDGKIDIREVCIIAIIILSLLFLYSADYRTIKLRITFSFVPDFLPFFLYSFNDKKKSKNQRKKKSTEEKKNIKSKSKNTYDSVHVIGGIRANNNTLYGCGKGVLECGKFG